ncbi:hypothetical protein [Synechocystis sp. CACIAM 05]|uniref:hypothetical protein n=1 Tax=Synechocystis sp. CACIAM 05 TaxID=1933929 RepID=UPI00138E56EB|nr:hypothetical protein [Synechocystis sp. CACIAM 05]QHV01149.1 hypothetical protein BWK47_14080 [Synechocystis sp. CACIAM 05]
MIKFSVFTPLDFVVRTSEEYWQKVILKHPDILGLENEVKATLSQPDQIRRSSRDPNILLFYLILKEKRWVAVVTRKLNGDGFLITAYQTDAIKEGEVLWQK